jgi:uncharacterized membrane protein
MTAVGGVTGADRSADVVLAAAVFAFYTAMLVITFAVHIPLNEELQAAGDPARIEDLAAVRDDFATPWVAWDIVRMLASAAAFGSLTWALALRVRRAA